MNFRKTILVAVTIFCLFQGAFSWSFWHSKPTEEEHRDVCRFTLVEDEYYSLLRNTKKLTLDCTDEVDCSGYIPALDISLKNDLGKVQLNEKDSKNCTCWVYLFSDEQRDHLLVKQALNEWRTEIDYTKDPERTGKKVQGIALACQYTRGRGDTKKEEIEELTNDIVKSTPSSYVVGEAEKKE